MLPYSSILQFAADHPWIAFFLSWPTMFLITSLAWGVATLIDNLYKTTLGLVAVIVNAIVVILRGYPNKEEPQYLDDSISQETLDAIKAEQDAAREDGRD